MGPFLFRSVRKPAFAPTPAWAVVPQVTEPLKVPAASTAGASQIVVPQLAAANGASPPQLLVRAPPVRREEEPRGSRASSKNTDFEAVILDTEATGRVPTVDHVIELAAARINSLGEVVSEWQSLVAPPPSAPAWNDYPGSQAEDITGINLTELQDAPLFADIWPDFKTWLGSRPIIAHNASYDVRALSSAVARATNVDWAPPSAVWCTVKLSRRILDQSIASDGYSLGALVQGLGLIPPGSRLVQHRAWPDVVSTVALWRALLDKLPPALGPPTPELISSIQRMSVPDARALVQKRLRGSQLRSRTLERRPSNGG